MGAADRKRAENESRFRSANEQIAAKAVELGVDHPVPFLCECADERCREILLLSMSAFREIRTSPTRFAIAPGHESGPDRVVERRDGFDVVEKQGDERRALQEEAPAEAEADVC